MGLLNKFRKEGEKESPIQEVMSNLSNLLDTHREFGAWQEGLGLGECCYQGSKEDFIKGVIQDVRYNIEHYEGRIKIVSIQAVESLSPFYLRLQLQCKLGEHFYSLYISFRKGGVEVELVP